MLSTLGKVGRPLPAYELALHVMAERGLNTADTALLQLFTRRTGALRRHHRKWNPLFCQG